MQEYNDNSSYIYTIDKAYQKVLSKTQICYLSEKL